MAIFIELLEGKGFFRGVDKMDLVLNFVRSFTDNSKLNCEKEHQIEKRC
jgi:hypothetical protein